MRNGSCTSRTSAITALSCRRSAPLIGGAASAAAAAAFRASSVTRTSSLTTVAEPTHGLSRCNTKAQQSMCHAKSTISPHTPQAAVSSANVVVISEFCGSGRHQSNQHTTSSTLYRSMNLMRASSQRLMNYKCLSGCYRSAEEAHRNPATHRDSPHRPVRAPRNARSRQNGLPHALA